MVVFDDWLKQNSWRGSRLYPKTCTDKEQTRSTAILTSTSTENSGHVKSETFIQRYIQTSTRSIFNWQILKFEIRSMNNKTKPKKTFIDIPRRMDHFVGNSAVFDNKYRAGVCGKSAHDGSSKDWKADRVHLSRLTSKKVDKSTRTIFVRLWRYVYEHQCDWELYTKNIYICNT